MPQSIRVNAMFHALKLILTQIILESTDPVFIITGSIMDVPVKPVIRWMAAFSI
jgi:hypothetical protein